MGWRDSLKARKSAGAEAAGGPQDITAIMSDEPEPDWFLPKNNGTYVGGDPAGRFRYLRFHLVGRVYLAGDVDETAARPLLGPENPDPTVGQFTAAGRFSVQRKFERPIICTVLDFDDAGFTARVTSTGPAISGEYRYDFRPDPV